MLPDLMLKYQGKASQERKNRIEEKETSRKTRRECSAGGKQ